MSEIIATNGYLGIKRIVHEIDDFVVLDNDDQCIINYNEDVPYFYHNDYKYYLDEFIRTNI